MRYRQGEYFFVQSRQMLTLVRPTMPQLVGQSQLELKDANGLAFNQALLEQIDRSGTAWVRYVWPKPGSPAPIGKSSVASCSSGGS